MRVRVRCLALFSAFVAGISFSQPPTANPIQPYSGTIWTTITFAPANGKTHSTTTRTEVSRDAAGNWRTAIYRPTAGTQHDTSAALDQVYTGTDSQQATRLAPSQSGGEVLFEDLDLGTQNLAGFLAAGRRRSFRSVAHPEQTHSAETWFSPALGTIVHSENHNFDGSIVVTDLSEVKLGPPAQDVTQNTSATVPAQPPNSQLQLYRALFNFVAHMESDRLANPPTQLANMVEIEDSLRKKVNLSPAEWQVLVKAAVKVDAYAKESDKQARDFAHQDRAAHAQNPTGPNTVAAGRATLHQMQLDLNGKVLADISGLETALGPDATTRIHAYLNGPLAASAHVIPVTRRKAVAQ